MGTENFRQLAAYNHWANLRLYGAALELPEEAYAVPPACSLAACTGRSIICC